MSGRTRWRVLYGALAVIAATVASPVGATAATAMPTEPAAVTWSVTPSDASGPDGRRVVELELDPGESATEHLAVRNLGEREATFSLTAADGYYTESGRFTMLPAGETSIAAGSWVEVEPEVTLAAGETRVVPYRVTVPAATTPGDHAAGIAASVRTTSADSEGTRVGVDSRVGFRVSTRVTGTLAPAASVDDVRAEFVASGSLFSPGRVEISYDLTNTGNTALDVVDTVGSTTAPRATVLPGESRRLAVDPVSAWPLGLVVFDLAVRATAPGTALEAAPVTTAVTVWAVPWLHLLAAAGLALVVLALVLGRRRSRRRVEVLVERAREEGRRESPVTVP